MLARLVVARRRVVPLSPTWSATCRDGSPARGRGRRTDLCRRAATRPGAGPSMPGPARLLVTDGPGYALRRSRTPWTPGASRRPSARPRGCRPRKRCRDWRRRWPCGARLRRARGGAGPGASAPASPSCGSRRWSSGPGRSWTSAWPPRRCPTWTYTSPLTPGARTPGGCWRWRCTGRTVGGCAGRAAQSPGGSGRAAGVDPGLRLRRLEADILAQDPGLIARPGRRRPRPGCGHGRRRPTTGPVAAGARARLETTVSLIRNLAVTGGGGLAAARQHRMEAIAAAEEFGDPDLTARVIGAYVPAIWTRSDDPAAGPTDRRGRRARPHRFAGPRARGRAVPPAGHDRPGDARQPGAARSPGRPRGGGDRPSSRRSRAAGVRAERGVHAVLHPRGAGPGGVTRSAGSGRTGRADRPGDL